MAKKAMINKENTRRELAAKGKYPTVRLHNRCSICGRPHGFHRDFGLDKFLFVENFTRQEQVRHRHGEYENHARKNRREKD